MAKEKFKLLKLLGGRPGGFAQTWQAEVLAPVLKARWGPVVAIKIPLSREKEKVLINELILNAVLQANLKQVQDSHIVRYLDFEQYDNQYVMVMEYVEGQSLRERIGDLGEGHPMPVAESLEIAAQVCQGLITMHRFNIFHRDIKPENILLSTPNGVVKIADLGIARMLLPSQLASTTTGTIYYMPKELLRGPGGDFYSDIYSLGVTLYEMLTGRVPFTGENLSKIIDNICTGESIPPAEINPEVDGKVSAIVLKAMDRDLGKRYQSAKDFRQAIEDYRNGADEALQEVERRILDIRGALGSGAGEKALKAATKLLKDFSNLEKTYLLIGDSFCRCLQHEKASEYLRAGVKKFPQSAALHRMLAICLYQSAKSKRLGACQETLNELEEAVRLAPDRDFAGKAKTLLEKWKQEVKS